MMLHRDVTGYLICMNDRVVDHQLMKMTGRVVSMTTQNVIVNFDNGVVEEVKPEYLRVL